MQGKSKMNSQTLARIQGTNIEIDPIKDGDFGLSVTIRSLCQLCKIEYVGQPARIQDDIIEIDPPRTGSYGISVPISKVREFYQR